MTLGVLQNATLNSVIQAPSGALYSVGATEGVVESSRGTRGILMKQRPDTADQNTWCKWYSTIPYPLSHTLSLSTDEKQLINCQDEFWDPLECTSTYDLTFLDEHFQDLVQLPNGDIIMAGSTNFDYWHEPISALKTSRRRDGWLVRVDSNGCYGGPCATITSIRTPSFNSFEVKVFPNPSSNFFNVQWETQTKVERVSVFDIVGRLVYEKPVSTGIILKDASAWPNGVYLWNLEVKEGNSSKVKLVKQ